MVLLFWSRVTQVVLEKRPLNECSSFISFKYDKSISKYFSATLLLQMFVSETLRITQYS